MKKFNFSAAIWLTFVALFLHLHLVAQTSEAIFASGGEYGAPGNMIKFYSYFTINPGVRYRFTAFDSIPGNYTNDLVVSGDIAFISADTFLLKYDLWSKKRTGKIALPGINRLNTWKNFLIASRWYPDTTGAYIEIFDTATLKIVYKDTVSKNPGYGITITNDTAYIAVPTYNKGLMEVISLNGAKPAFVKMISLDSNSANLTDMYSYDNNITNPNEHFVYGLSYTTYPPYKHHLVSYNLNTGKFTNVYDSLGQNGIDIYKGFGLQGCVEGVSPEIYADFGDGIQTFDFSNNKITSTVIKKHFTKGIYDAAYGFFYITNSDFKHPDKIYVVNSIRGNIVDSFYTGVSTQAMGMHYYVTVGIEQSNPTNLKLTLYPNPASSQIHLYSSENNAIVYISDITGQVVYSENKTDLNNGASIDVSGLTNGVYIVHLVSETGTADVKFIKK